MAETLNSDLVHRYHDIPPPCPVCGSQSTILLCEANGFAIWRCPESAIDFAWPFPDDSTMKHLYAREAWFEGGEPGGYVNYDTQTDPTTGFFTEILKEHEKTGAHQSILDIGCGYGTHLSIAAQRGWKCFGVEISEHARKIARQRHGSKLFIVDRLESLTPHTFDLIILFDVLEHLKDPYMLFYALFSKGAIGKDTTVIITTPNARSSHAVADPAGWTFRHPPSHLVFYSGHALRFILTRLHFPEIQISGQHSVDIGEHCVFEDEDSDINNNLAGYAGLVCKARGSDFAEFMHERYVPKTWSKIAEYEHLPRYVLAKSLAKNSRVLDFGCGTGYGAAILSEVAEHVMGLDIDDAALTWAVQTHHKPNLRFEKHSDLGIGLPEKTFDLITCFEMIEHVNEQLQIDAVRNFARLLKPDGKLIISTPNPSVSRLYGKNPYHLREMNEQEFRQLLQRFFSHIIMLKQWIRPSVTIDCDLLPRNSWIICDNMSPEEAQGHVEPSAYIAICSRSPIDNVQGMSYFDSSADYTSLFIDAEKRLNKVQLRNYELLELMNNQEARRSALEEVLSVQKLRLQELQKSYDSNLNKLSLELNTKDIKIESIAAEITVKNRELERLSRALQLTDAELAARNNEIQAFRQSKLFRLNQTLLDKPLTVRKAAKIIYLVGALIAPEGLKRHLRQPMMRFRSFFPHAVSCKENLFTRGLKGLFEIGSLMAPERAKRMFHPFLARIKRKYPVLVPNQCTTRPYAVRTLRSPEPHRPVIVHAIANFMLGGSSRLVIDLMEQLGHQYEQKVITSHVPDPPAYTGLDILEFGQATQVEQIIAYLEQIRPHLLHVHYWGDIDRPWYEKVFAAAQHIGCSIIENVNTPVEPYTSNSVVRYVYVSDYVNRTFGGETGSKSTVIYPGSDFSLFKRRGIHDIPDNCIGMVYRLEMDKLNQKSIEVFIKVVKKRPGTKVLIVGGGTYLAIYKREVLLHRVAHAFTFTGYVPYEDLPSYYEQMSIFVAPVWKESFGHVSPIAMHMGIPVVGYDIGALGEIIGNDDRLAPPGDSDRLADIIISLLNDRDRRLASGREDQERARARFSLEATIARYDELYQAILSGGQHEDKE